MYVNLYKNSTNIYVYNLKKKIAQNEKRFYILISKKPDLQKTVSIPKLKIIK